MRTLIVFGLIALAGCGLAFAQTFHKSLGGAFANDYLGNALSGIADLNGDGVDDLLVGVPGFDGIAVDSGLVLVLSGKNLNLLFYLSGPSLFARFGSSLAAVPDIDGDGIEEIAVGAPGFGPGNSTGAVFLYSGSGGQILDTATGSHKNAYLGESLASGFDVDGDGKGDILAGEPGYNHDTLTQCGAVRLFSGEGLKTIFLAHGFDAYDQLGRSVTLVEDINGDGRPEAVGGMPGFDPEYLPGAGGAALFSGPTGGLLHVYEGLDSFAGFGAAVAAFPDLNGDQLPEIASGAPNAWVGSHYNAGMVAFYSGAGITPYQVLSGSLSNQFFGRAVSSAGHFDTDGILDIAIGMRRPFLDPGTQGAVRIYSGFDTGFLTDLLPGLDGYGFGGSITPIGDVNGDGWGDLAVGDPSSNLHAPTGGEVRTYLGSVPYLRIDSTGKLGDPLDLNLRGYPGDPALVMMDLEGGPTTTPYGIFDLGFSQALILFPLVTIDATGLLSFHMTIPNLPELEGLTLYFQALVLHDSGYLISSSDHILIID